MRWYRGAFTLGLFWILVSPFTGAAQLVLKNASVINLESGSVESRRTISVVDGLIRAVEESPLGEAGDGPDSEVRVVDLEGRFVIPGLWDMHIHPRSLTDLKLLLANGVLGARIMRGSPLHLFWRTEIESGKRRPGPRVIITGPIIEGTPPQEFADVIDTAGRELIDTREQARAEATAQIAAGYDYLKVYNNLNQEAYSGLSEVSRRHDFRIVGHIPFGVGLLAALEGGQLSIEHLRGYVQHVVPSDAPIQPGPDLRSRTLAWQFAEPSRVPSLVQATLEAGVWHCPTLSARIFFATPDEIETYLDSEDAPFISPRFKANLRDRTRITWLSNFSEKDFADAARGFQQQDRLLVALKDAGVPILAGTDMAPLGFALHGELERLVNAGLSELEALRAAISNPVQFLKVGHRPHWFDEPTLKGPLGKIAKGYSADLVILDRNPLDNIRHTRSIQAVVSRGQWLDRAQLDSLLEEASRSLE